MKAKDYSPSVVAIIGGGSKKPPAGEAKPDEAEDSEGAAWTSFGKALRAAVESKDDAAIGAALRDAVEYCMPAPESEK